MLKVKSRVVSVLLLSLLFTSTWSPAKDSPWLQSAKAAEGQATATKPVSRVISQKELEKYKSISVTVEENGKDVKYTGIPLRTLLAELLPESDLDSMKGWKAIARQELVLEVTAEDGYPGLVTALEVAINKSGERYLLATHKDGKLIDAGVKLVCKSDEAHTRWVHEVVRLRLVAVEKATDTESK